MLSEDSPRANQSDLGQQENGPPSSGTPMETSKLHQRLRRLAQENAALKQRLSGIEASRLWKLGMVVTRLRRWLPVNRNKASTHGRSSQSREALAEPLDATTQDASKLAVQLEKHGATHHVSQRLSSAGTTLQDLIKKDLGTLFLLPFKGSGGGLHSVVQEAEAMHMLGFRVAIAAPANLKTHYKNTYPKATVFRYYDDQDEILNWRQQFRVVVATYFTSMELLEQLWLADPNFLCAYYIQDYEPWFFKGGSEWERVAYRSYGRIPGMIHFAKTRFLCETLFERHNLNCDRVEPSFDHSVFFRTSQGEGRPSPSIVTAMIRPETPWRRPVETMDVLNRLKQTHGKALEIHLFGCDPNSPAFLSLQAEFPFVHHGKLLRHEVASLLNKAAVFLDLSIYQGFGRTGLEAMACGCVPVLPEKCGPDTYAVQGENAILINTGDRKAAEAAVTELIKNDMRREAMVTSGLATAKRYSVPQTALDEIMLFQKKWQARTLDDS